MKFVYVVVVIAILASPVLSRVDCGADKCKDKGQRHPICIYGDRRPSPSCGEIKEMGIGVAEQIEIVNVHNELRSYVAQGFEGRGKPGPQPPAKHMNMLLWDYELSKAAQAWVNQCSFSRAPCFDESRFPVGQTMGFKGAEATATDIIKGVFYEQVKFMNSWDVANLSTVNDTVKDYMQLVWAETSRIGCGKIISTAHEGIWTYLLLCLYGTTGNVIGQPVYEISDDYLFAQLPQNKDYSKSRL